MICRPHSKVCNTITKVTKYHKRCRWQTYPSPSNENQCLIQLWGSWSLRRGTWPPLYFIAKKNDFCLETQENIDWFVPKQPWYSSINYVIDLGRKEKKAQELFLRKSLKMESQTNELLQKGSVDSLYSLLINTHMNNVGGILILCLGWSMMDGGRV